MHHPSQIIGKPVVSFLSPDSANGVPERIAELLKDGDRSPLYEHKVVGSDGMEKDIEVIGTYVTYKGRPAIQIMVRDVTERKKSEKILRESEKQLRFLSTRLLMVQEEERKRIAGELHDNIGQHLSAIKFGIENVIYRCKQGESSVSLSGVDSAVESLEALISLTQSAIRDTRRIYMDLRPSILDDFGIIATIGWFCRQFRSIYTGISIEAEINIEEGEIPESLKITVFRIIQEAFHNIAKHSKAELILI